eukprot:scaffold285647_cov32-Prasinocladus_malaysianus.AAC.1
MLVGRNEESSHPYDWTFGRFQTSYSSATSTCIFILLARFVDSFEPYEYGYGLPSIGIRTTDTGTSTRSRSAEKPAAVVRVRVGLRGPCSMGSPTRTSTVVSARQPHRTVTNSVFK